MVNIVINHEYHVVEMHKVTNEVLTWLNTQYGHGDGTRWWYRHPRIFFLDPKDHMIFLLRWA